MASDDQLIESVRRALREDSESLVAAYLFGRVAGGDVRAGSDVDVAALLGVVREGAFERLALDLRDRLEGRIGHPVDLVVLDTAPPDLVHRVLRDGVLVFESDPAARIAFEVRARNVYFDLKPYLDEYRRVPGGAT